MLVSPGRGPEASAPVCSPAAPPPAQRAAKSGCSGSTYRGSAPLCSEIAFTLTRERESICDSSVATARRERVRPCSCSTSRTRMKADREQVHARADGARTRATSARLLGRLPGTGPVLGPGPTPRNEAQSCGPRGWDRGPRKCGRLLATPLLHGGHDGGVSPEARARTHRADAPPSVARPSRAPCGAAHVRSPGAPSPP